MSDDESFIGMLGDDVVPIKKDKRVSLSSRKVDRKTLSHRRHEAQTDVDTSLDPLASDPVEMVDPLSVLSFQRPGVQHGVLRNLRLGKYRLDAHLDLHKKTKEIARNEVYQFINDCVENDVRFALITHGKGEGREQPALLKSCIAYWLPQMDSILAFHTAQKHHGGYGATYVLLRKSDRKKKELREQHGHPEKGD